MTPSFETTARELLATLTAINQNLDYPFTQPLMNTTEALSKALRQAHAAGLEEAAEIAYECTQSNVENMAIDMFERQRRSGIRWGGEYAVMRIRARAAEVRGK